MKTMKISSVLFFLLTFQVQAQISLSTDNTGTINIIKGNIIKNENNSYSLKKSIPIVPGFSSVTSSENDNSKRVLSEKEQAQYSQHLRGNGMKFTPNKGQIIDTDGRLRPDVLYKGSSSGADIYLRKTGISYAYNNMIAVKQKVEEKMEELKKAGEVTDLNEKQKENELMQKQTIKVHRVDMDFVNINSNTMIINEEEVEGYNNYYYAHCPQGITNVKQYNKITYRNIYKDIDVEYYGNNEQGLEYDIVIQPHADASQIKIQWTGAENIQVNKEGNLIIKTSLNEFYESVPKVYQNINGKNISIKAKYDITTDKSRGEGYFITFKLGTFNSNYPLIIDPWVTYYGGSDEDQGFTIATDNTGNVVITGNTKSIDFPVSNGFQMVIKGSYDAFIVKFNEAGTPVWATYYGGSSMEVCYGLAIDNTGNIIIPGYTISSDLPGINGTSYKQINNSFDAFVAKFNGAGNLIWVTYYGGTDMDWGYNAATDNTGNVILSGYTTSSDLPGVNGYQISNHGGYCDAFLVKFNGAGNLIWATYYGGSEDDYGCGITTDNTGNIILTGCTSSPDLPGVNGYQMANRGGAFDSYIVKFNGAGNLIYATYYGGNGADYSYCAAVDNSGNIIVSGDSYSTNLSVLNGYQMVNNGDDDAFVAKFNGTLKSLIWATYLGGSGFDHSNRFNNMVLEQSTGNIYLTEGTHSNGFLPTTACSWQQANAGPGGQEDVFLVCFSGDGKIICSSYLGGTLHDEEGGVALYGCYVYIGGMSPGNFPVTPGAFQTSYGGGVVDAYVAQFYKNICGPDNTLNINFTNNTNVCPNVPVNFTPNYTSCDTIGIAYQWTFTGGNPSSSTVKNPVVTYPAQGTYSVKLVVNTPCRKDSIIKPVAVVINPCGITATVNSEIICAGACPTLTASGADGTAPYTYKWNTNATTTSITPCPITTTTYSVTATDNSGLTASATAVVTVNNNLVLSTTGSTICKGNTATISVSGGTTYTWNTGFVGNQLNLTPTVNTTYTVTGTDVNGCTKTAQAVVIVNPLPNITANGGSTCLNSPINVVAGGGNNYTWDTGYIGNSLNVTPLVNTTYTVTGIDANGCTNTAQATVTINSTISINTTNPAICNGNSTIVSAFNGISYTWSTIATGSDITVNPNVTTTYYVTGINAQGCSGTGFSVVTVNQIPNVTATGGVICNGDNINISANNATTYTWDTGSNNNPYNVNPNVTTTYTVTGTDNNACSNTTQAIVTVNPLPNVTATGNPICTGSTSTLTAGGANTYTWDNGLGIGNIKTVSPTISTVYIVTGTDINSCTATAKVVICVSINSPISVNSPAICYGTSATLNASGVLTYTWNNSQTGNTITVNPITTTTYFVSGTDANSCTNTAQSVVTVSPQISLNIINQKDASCGFANGSATVTASGGIPYTTGILNYNCIWSTGETTPTISNLKAGTYTVTVTDSIGCSAVTTVTIGDTPPVVLSVSSTNASCFPNGTATVTPTSGTQPYTYIWSDGQTTQTAININSGTYFVTVTDVAGCTATTSVIVNENNPLLLIVSPTPEHCGKIDGTATANTSGGNSALYTYLWDNGGTTKTINNLSQGNYIVTVNYGTCKITGTTAIGETYGPNADFTYTPAILDIFENTTALFEDLSTPGGQPIIKWHWDFYDDNSYSDIRLPAHTYKNIGTYTVCLRVTDSENCVDSICKPIVVKDIFTVYIPNAFSPNSDMLNEGFIPQGYNIDPTEFQMMIFNRWGEMIYKTTDINIPWNGRYMNNGDVVQVGVYVYKVIVKEKDGPEHEFIGRVTVVR